jgi:hypothetical protein
MHQPPASERIIGSITGIEEVQVAVIQTVVDMTLEGDVVTVIGIGPRPEVLIEDMAGSIGVEFVSFDDSTSGTEQDRRRIEMILQEIIIADLLRIIPGVGIRHPKRFIQIIAVHIFAELLIVCGGIFGQDPPFGVVVVEGGFRSGNFADSVTQGVIIERGDEIPHAIFDQDDTIFIIVEIDIPLPILSHVAGVVVEDFPVDPIPFNPGIAIGQGIADKIDRFDHAIVANRLFSYPVAQIVHHKRLDIVEIAQILHIRQAVEIVITELIIRGTGSMVKILSVDIVLIGDIGVSELDQRRAGINGRDPAAKSS